VAPTTAPTPAPTPTVHRVRRGETLTGIADEYGVTISALRKANGILDPNLIIVGQVLVIPTR
jgi:LysM repeat protein